MELNYCEFCQNTVFRGVGCTCAGILNASSDPLNDYGATYITKDSGKREEFTSGMVRDTQDDKPQYDLVDWPMIERWALLMGRGAKKYGRHNWKKAAGEAELERFKASALRHLVQWFRGDVDEDHAAAVYFNIAGAEMVRAKLVKPELPRC